MVSPSPAITTAPQLPLRRPVLRQSIPSSQAPEAFFRNIRYVTLKVTNGCNLKCSYCNVDADLPSTPRMSMETFKRVADLLIKNSIHKDVGLEFHGGEPLLMSEDWMEEAVGYAQSLARQHGKTCEHPMQTNGTKLTPQRLEHLLKLNVKVGISLDGPPHINDRHRMAGKRVEQSVRMLIERKLPFGMILVLSRSNCQEMGEVMRYFQGLGLPGFRVNFMQPQGLGMEHSILTGDEMFNGMKEVFNHMADTKCSVLEATTQLMVNRFAYGRVENPPLSCWELECQAGRVYCAVNLHGDVHACGTDMAHHRLGSVWDGFDESHTKSTLCSLHRKDPWYARCFGCEARRICPQSCPTSDANSKAYRDAECDYTRKLYSYFCSQPKRIYQILSTLTAQRPGSQMLR